LKIHFNIIFPSTSESFKWSLSLRFPHKNPLFTFLASHMWHMPSSFRSFFISLPLLCLIRGTHHKAPQHVVLSAHLDQDIILSTQFSYTLSLCFSLRVRDQASHL
jgi:hypothetical protein